MKHGKLTFKVKTLTKDLQNARGQKAKSSSPEDNLLDMAIQDELKSQVAKAEKEATELKKQLKELKNMETSYASLKSRLEEVENVLSNTRQERDDLSGRVIELQLQTDALMEEQEILRNVDVEKNNLREECESLKLRLESSQTEKSSGTVVASSLLPPVHPNSTEQMQEEYAHFQDTNRDLQVEIESLKTCIDNQTSLNEELQRQLNTFHHLGGQKFSVDGLGADQIQATSYFESHPGLNPQHTLSQVTSQLITSTPTKVQLLQQIGDRERHDSASTDRESEIRRIFDQGIKSNIAPY